MRRVFTFLFLLAVGSGGPAAPVSAGWISPAGEGPGPARVTAAASGPDRLRVTVELPGFLSEDVTVAGESYVRLRVPGSPYLLEAGEPELPYVTANLALPPRGTPTVRVLESRWQEVPSPPVVPSRGNVLRDRAPDDVPLRFGAVYSAGGVSPAVEQVLGRPYLVRGRRGVGLRVHPLRWDADRGVLLVLQRLELEIVTSGDGGANVRPGPAPPAQTGYAEVWSRRFVNAAPDKYRPLPTGGRLLVVCADGFGDAVQPFAQWKRERGLVVEVATVADLGGTAESIAAAVSARYFAPEGLGYVVLAGDAPGVPTFLGLYEGAVDDTRYALVDGEDLYPDLFVSRVSARDETELLTQLEKFIRYERDPEPGGDWYPHGAGIASILGDPTDAERADGLRADLLNFTYETVDRLYEPAATDAAIKAALEEGRSLVNYLGHGSGTAWSNPPFDLADVGELTNGHRWPLIIDVSCANGKFTIDECFAEAWLRAGTPAAPHGAIAMYSASTSTPWVPPTVMQDEAIDLLSAGGTWEIGAICQQGMMRVLDVYPGDIGRQLIEQYNIFGDCSLRLRTARPIPPSVVHAGALAAGVPVFPLETGVPGATVTLTAPGVLHGVAVADESGGAVVTLAEPPTAAGELVLTVTGPNLLTHRETIPVLVPVQAVLDRASVPVGTTTALNVDLTAATGFSGDVAVTVAGYGVPATTQIVGQAGRATFVLLPSYGEDLAVTGRAVASGWDLFHVALPVDGAASLTAPGVAVAVPDVGMTGSLAPGRAGNVRGWSGASGVGLAVTGCGVDTVVSAAGDTALATVVPQTTGSVTAAVLVPGHRVHVVAVPVLRALGTVSGRVTDGGVGVAHARVQIRSGDDAPLIDAVTDAGGHWFHERDLDAGPYELRISAFGYVDSVAVRPLLHGVNDWTTELRAAPRQSVAGTVTEAGTGSPLAAVLDVHRRETGQLVATARAGIDGVYTTVPLPAGTYEAVLTHPGYVPRTFEFAVDVDGGDRDDTMTPLTERVLVIADNLPMDVPYAYPAKLDKRGGVDHFSYSIVPNQSGITAIQDLLSLGYDATYLPWFAAQGTDWNDYDAVMVACGDNPEPLQDGLLEAVGAHVAAGGRLLLEGGELAAAFAADATFLRDVLHVARWSADAVAIVDLDVGAHALTAGPARIYEGAAFQPVGYATGDEIVPASDARTAFFWPEAAGAIITYDPDADPTGGQIVFAALDLSRLDRVLRQRLLQNAVEYLLHRPVADAALSGRLITQGTPETPSRIRLEPGGTEADAGPEGTFRLDGLVPGEYRAYVTAPDHATVSLPVTLAAAGTADLGDLTLAPAGSVRVTDDGAEVIPDDDPIGLRRVLTVDAAGPVSGVRVWLDVDHPYEADLTVDLSAPDGTTIRLRHGGAAAGPATGTSTRDLVPELDTFVGREVGGTWLLRVTDTVLLDEGSLRGWALDFEHAVQAGGSVPTVLRVLANRPNPFNPTTTLRFAMPRPGRAELDIHDLRGRCLRRLGYEAMAAGEHEVVFDGRDAAGRDLASGAYLVRVRAGGETATGKILLLR